MKSILSALMVGLFLFSAPKISAATDFYQWVSETGALEFTDDMKTIPVKYADRIQERSWAELAEKTDQRFTPVTVPFKPVVALTPIEADVSKYVLEANAEEEAAQCQQPIRRLPASHRQVGDYTRPVYAYTDSCGRVSTEADFSPRIHMR